MPDTDPLYAATAAMDDVGRPSLDEWTEGTTSEVAARLIMLNRLTAQIYEIRKALELSLVLDMDEDALVVPGFGQVKRTEETSWNWRDKSASKDFRNDLAEAVARTVSTDVATGEMDPAKRNVALATMREALAAIPAFTTLLKPGRERLGMSIYDYRESKTSYRITIDKGVTDES